LGEVTVIAHALGHLGGLSKISERVRFARRGFGHDDLTDFAVVLLGDAISRERLLEVFSTSPRSVGHISLESLASAPIGESGSQKTDGYHILAWRKRNLSNIMMNK
jgi:hypothetical protein